MPKDNIVSQAKCLLKGRSARPRLGAFCFLCSAMILCLTSSAFGQTSVGFRDPRDIRSLLDYRLGSWGYNRLLLNLHLSGSGENSKHIGEFEQSSCSYVLATTPAATVFRESDDHDIHAVFELDARLGRDEWDYWTTDHLGESEDWRYEIAFRNSTTWHRYFQPNFFHLLAGDIHVSYQEFHRESERTLSDSVETWETRKEIDRRVNTSVRAGLGYGRVRNVSPVVRALRFNERLRALGRAENLQPSQIQSLAEIIARQYGYRYVYERSGKYFWSDLFDQLDDVQSFTPFETHYLSEIFSEYIGERYQGWDISSGFEARNVESHRRYLEKTAFVLFAQGSYYNNFSLNHQLGLRALGDYGTIFDDADPEETAEGSFRFRTEFLWILTDRFSWSSQLGVEADFRQVKDSSSQEKKWFRNSQYLLTSRLQYYIEDHLSFVTGMTLTSSHQEIYFDPPYEHARWSLSSGLVYYLDKSLK